MAREQRDRASLSLTVGAAVHCCHGLTVDSLGGPGSVDGRQNPVRDLWEGLWGILLAQAKHGHGPAVSDACPRPLGSRYRWAQR